MLITKVLQLFLVDKNTSTLSNPQEQLLFSLPKPLSNKQVAADFSSPDISLNAFGILRRVVTYLHQCWPGTIIELRGDNHFCSHEFMDWPHGLPYIRYTTGLSENRTSLAKVDRERKRDEKEFQKDGKSIRRFYKLDYKVKT